MRFGLLIFPCRRMPCGSGRLQPIPGRFTRLSVCMYSCLFVCVPAFWTVCLLVCVLPCPPARPPAFPYLPLQTLTFYLCQNTQQPPVQAPNLRWASQAALHVEQHLFSAQLGWGSFSQGGLLKAEGLQGKPSASPRHHSHHQWLCQRIRSLS